MTNCTEPVVLIPVVSCSPRPVYPDGVVSVILGGSVYPQPALVMRISETFPDPGPLHPTYSVVIVAIPVAVTPPEGLN